MNILQINSVCGIGSTGRIATDLHALLLERGHNSTIAFGREFANNCAQTICVGNRLDNYLHFARTRLFDGHGFGSLSATKKFIKQVEIINPDIIQLHNIHGYYLNCELLFKYLKLANKPVIWTLHDCWSFTGHCSHFDFINCDRWKNQCYNCPAKGDYPKSLIFERSALNYQKKKHIFCGVNNLTLITPSKWMSDILKESFLREYPVKVINNGVDISIFKPTQGAFRRRYNLNDAFIILGVASFWSIRKGYQYFIELSTQLQYNEKIVLVGLTEKQIKRLPTGIIGIAKTNSTKELAEIYGASDVFVNPTLEDNFPTTNLEALACGTPIITFNSGGSPECLSDECGYVVDRGDLMGLIKAIRAIKNTGKNNYENKCQKRAAEYYDKDDRYGEYVEMFEGYIGMY